MMMGTHYQMREINPDGGEQRWGKFILVLFISTEIFSIPSISGNGETVCIKFLFLDSSEMSRESI